MSLFDDASLVVTPNGVKEGKLYSVKPTDGSGDLNVVRATTATRVNADGFIETVDANVPRLDYTNGSCPSILVEPQRTNLFTYSEQFDNANWLKTNAVVTTNATTSPDGTMTADKVDFAVSSTSIIDQFVSYSVGNLTHTISCYVKANSGTQDFRLKLTQAGVVNYYSPYYTATTQWQRFSFTQTFGSGGSGFYAGIRANNGTLNLWGVQLEANSSNATSYIPTVASSVTRNADVISKTGISDLIGQTEGTIFVDAKSFINSVDFSSLRRCYLILTDGTFSNRIEISKFGSNNILLNNDIKVRISSSGSTIFDQTVATNYSGNLKLALAYKSGSTVVYVNGVNVYEYNTAYTVPATSFLDLGNGYNQPTTDSLNYISIWKTRLTDSELATLTTI